MKRCSKCGEIKSIDEFSNYAGAKDGKQYWCKDCQMDYKLQHKIEKKEYNLKYYNKNVEEILLQHQRTYIRAWCRNSLNKHKNNGFLISVSIDFVNNMAKNTINCPICGKELDWEYGHGYTHATPTIDRINNETELREDNIWIICRDCNTSKLNRTFDEFVNYCEIVYKKFDNR